MSPKPITRFGYWKWVWSFSAPANFPAVYIREAIDVIDHLVPVMNKNVERLLKLDAR